MLQVAISLVSVSCLPQICLWDNDKIEFQSLQGWKEDTGVSCIHWDSVALWDILRQVGWHSAIEEQL